MDDGPKYCDIVIDLQKEKPAYWANMAFSLQCDNKPEKAEKCNLKLTVDGMMEEQRMEFTVAEFDIMFKSRHEYMNNWPDDIIDNNKSLTTNKQSRLPMHIQKV